jgi:hypothetical protein
MELNNIPNLTQTDRRTLESMGVDSVEKVAQKSVSELGLAKKGERIIQVARNILAHQNIRGIVVSADLVTVTLADTSKAVITSVEHVLNARHTTTERNLSGDQLLVSKMTLKPCLVCQKEAEIFCKDCGEFFCGQHRYHGPHYNIKKVKDINSEFDEIKQAAQEYVPMPSDKRREIDLAPASEVVKRAQEVGFSGFAETFFSELEGSAVMKRALTCALFSTPEEPVHVLVVGDPAGGKSLARDIITRKLGTDIELVGANATRAGLVCNLSNGELGVLAYAKNKIVLVDEFDKIPEQDIENCYELLSNGKCSVHSAKIHETIESHFIMIALANPVNTVFVEEPISEIGLRPVLLSRFALIVKVEDIESDTRKKLLRKKLLGEKRSEELADWHLPWLREARKFKPRLVAADDAVDRYIEQVDSIIEEHLKSPLRRDLRMGDYAKRIPYCIARASFSDVTDEVLAEAISLVKDSLSAWISW